MDSPGKGDLAREALGGSCGQGCPRMSRRPRQEQRRSSGRQYMGAHVHIGVHAQVQ